jgi:hypothetical protein
MGTTKIKPKTRKVVFTDHQMLTAKETGKFPTHREFVEFLFKRHKVKVINHALLEYKYVKEKVGYTNCIIQVTGVIGSSLGWM